MVVLSPSKRKRLFLIGPRRVPLRNEFVSIRV